MRRREDLDEDIDGIVVVPPLGDREVDNGVRRLLARGVMIQGSSSSTGSRGDPERNYAAAAENRDYEMD